MDESLQEESQIKKVGSREMKKCLSPDAAVTLPGNEFHRVETEE